MVNLSSNNSNNVRISAGGQRNINVNSPTDNNINANNNGNSQRARSWAIGEGLIDGEDYSAKYWAEQAKISEEIARESADAENNAHIWAEGTDEEVEAIGGTHSSKGWVDYVIENAPTASVEETASGAVLTVTDINGTTTATIYNGADGQDGQDGRDGTDGVNGQDGQDGFSPIATVTQTSNGATISITDKNGTTTANIANGINGTNGRDGTNGTNGEDGFSPTATVTKSGSVATITITDKNGTTTANVYDGTGGGGGIQNTATGTDSLTILGTASTADYSVNIGINSEINADEGVAIGCEASAYSGVAIGRGAEVDSGGGVAIGISAGVSNNGDIAIGDYAGVNGTSAIALGYQASATASNAIQIGNGDNSDANTLQIGNYTLLDTSTGLIPDARLSSNVCTTNTAQSISGRKTFLGEKAIYFKQSATTNKLGFTLYNPSDTELGAFEWRPSTIGNGALLNVNVPYSSSNYVGFRYWGTAVNIIAPKVATAGNYYIPTHITDGNTTVTANSSGTVNISSLLPNVSGYLENTATGWGSLTILGTSARSDMAINIGANSTIQGTRSIAIGNESTAETLSVAIGYQAAVTASSSIQLGNGTNSTQNTLQVGNYTLLNTSTGLIPDARLSSNIARTSQIPTAISDLTDDTATTPIDKVESVVDNNSGSLNFWSGTKAQYDAIVTKDANTLYNITDDANPTLSMLELLYPVGSIYIGTMSACPLQTLGVGTWQLVATDKVLQGAGTRGSVGTTVNESLPNIKGNIEASQGSTGATSGGMGVFRVTNGAFTGTANYQKCPAASTTGWAGSASNLSIGQISLNASRSSSTYQDNAPVQQDAYVVNIWERIS